MVDFRLAIGASAARPSACDPATARRDYHLKRSLQLFANSSTSRARVRPRYVGALTCGSQRDVERRKSPPAVARTQNARAPGPRCNTDAFSAREHVSAAPDSERVSRGAARPHFNKACRPPDSLARLAGMAGPPGLPV